MEGLIEGEELRPNIAARLLIVFPEAKRPDRSGIFEAVSHSQRFQVSHDPGPPEGGLVDSGAWLELLMNGLTFDCLGLQPGPPMQRAEPRNFFDVVENDTILGECLAIAPGPHLVGAENTIPVVRTLVSLGVELVSHLDAALAVQWEPSASLIGRNYFQKIGRDWTAGGAFPSLGLCGVLSIDDGSLRTDGLTFFIGQEIELDRALCADRVEASRLIVRLADRLVEAGPLEQSTKLEGIRGDRLFLDLSKDRKTVRVVTN